MKQNDMKDLVSGIVERETDAIKEELTERPLNTEIEIVTIGGDHASEVYVNNKKKLLSAMGIDCVHTRLNKEISQHELNSIIAKIERPALLQLPLPDGLNAPKIPKRYDIDGFSPEALGDLAYNDFDVMPCTVQGIFDIIDEVNIDVTGKRVAVIGCSKIVGLPLIIALVNKRAIISSFNSTATLEELDWSIYDIIVSATGSHGTLKASQLAANQLVIDVGINRVDGKLCGDIEHDCESDAKITPVPGGVGRLTVLNVVKNAIKLVRAYEPVIVRPISEDQ